MSKERAKMRTEKGGVDDEECFDLSGWIRTRVLDRPAIIYAELICMRTVKRSDGYWEDACLGHIVLRCDIESEESPDGKHLNRGSHWAECDKCGVEYIFDANVMMLRPLIKKRRSRLLPQRSEGD